MQTKVVVLFSILLLFAGLGLGGKTLYAQSDKIFYAPLKYQKQVTEQPKLSTSEPLFIPRFGRTHRHAIPKDKIRMDAPVRTVNNGNVAFLISVALLLFFGIVKWQNPIYFRHFIDAFRNPILSIRQLKEQLQQDYMPGLMLDILFCLSASFFLFSVLKQRGITLLVFDYSSVLTLLLVAVGFALMYQFRLVFLRFFGWLFEIKDVISNFSFNVKLFNRMLGVVLIPFSIILNFGFGYWTKIVLSIALLIILTLFVFRFVRSRNEFKYFFRNNKFHFMLYLCALEIIPMALLIKFVGTYWAV